MKIILFLAAVYALIINQAQQKKTAIPNSERSYEAIQLQVAENTLSQATTAQYPFFKQLSRNKTAPAPAVIQYTVLRPMIIWNY